MNNDEKFSLTARSGIRASSFFRYSPFVTRHSGLIRSLVLGAWCFSGAWMLELGASAATLELRLALFHQRGRPDALRHAPRPAALRLCASPARRLLACAIQLASLPGPARRTDRLPRREPA